MRRSRKAELLNIGLLYSKRKSSLSSTYGISICNFAVNNLSMELFLDNCSLVPQVCNGLENTWSGKKFNNLMAFKFWSLYYTHKNYNKKHSNDAISLMKHSYNSIILAMLE